MKLQEYYEDTYWNEHRSKTTVTQPGKQIERIKEILARHLPESASVLDVGCGDGSIYGRFIQPCARMYVGTDLSLTALHLACQVGLQGVLCNIERSLPFQSGSFAAAICMEVLEHLFDPVSLLQEIERVSIPGSLIVVSVPNIAHLPHRLRLLAGKFVAGGLPATADTPWCDPHIRFFTIRSLRDMLLAADLTLVGIYGANTALLTTMPVVSVLFNRVLGRQRFVHVSEFFEPLGYIWPTLFAGRLIAVAQTKIREPQ